MKKILEEYIEILALGVWGILVLQLLQFILSYVEGM
jgi:hypothetical protein